MPVQSRKARSSRDAAKQRRGYRRARLIARIIKRTLDESAFKEKSGYTIESLRRVLRDEL